MKPKQRWIHTQTLITAALFIIIIVNCAIIANSQVHDNHESNSKNGNPEKKIKLYQSKFDFIPGEKIIWYETFNEDALGDFPANWNTNATGEVVKTEGQDHKSLMLHKDGVYLPLGVNNLPENFTLQFDLACYSDFNYYSSPFQILFASLNSKKEFTVLKQYNPHNKDLVKLWLHPNNAADDAGHSGFEII